MYDKISNTNNFVKAIGRSNVGMVYMVVDKIWSINRRV